MSKKLYAVDSNDTDSLYLIRASSEAAAWAFFAAECLDDDVENAQAGYTMTEANVLEAP